MSLKTSEYFYNHLVQIKLFVRPSLIDKAFTTFQNTSMKEICRIAIPKIF